MKLPICNFDISKKLKEIGFELETLNFYTKPRSKMFGIDEHGRAYPIHNTAKKLYTCGEDVALNSASVYSAPTLVLVQMWLREEHRIHVSVGKNVVNKLYFVEIDVWGHTRMTESLKLVQFDTYDQALEAGILEAIKTKQDD